MISSRGTSLAARKCATGLGFSCFSTSLRSTYCWSRDQQTDYKQLLDEVFVISGKIKVEVSVISRRLGLITLTETLIIPDTTKTSSNNCFIILYLQVISQFLAGSMKRIEKPYTSPYTSLYNKRTNLLSNHADDT